MKSKLNVWNMIGWVAGLAVIAIGILNIFLVHPVPGAVYLLISLVYFPATNTFLRKKFGWGVPAGVKIILGIVIVMFTLGVSDLGDMIDDRHSGVSNKLEALK